MSRHAHRSAAALVLATLVGALLGGCVAGSVESQTDAIVADLTGLPGVASGSSIVGEPSLESTGTSRVSLNLEPTVDAAQLEAIVRRWSELHPRVPASVALEASLAGAGGVEHALEISTDADLVVAIEESAAWLRVTEQVERVLLTVRERHETSTTSAWDVRLDASAGRVATEVADLRGDLATHGTQWIFTTAEGSTPVVELSAAGEYPPDEVAGAADSLVGLALPESGLADLWIGWSPEGQGAPLDIVADVEPPEFAELVGSEYVANVPGSAAERFADAVRSGFRPPSVPTRLAFEVYTYEYLVLDNAACAGQPTCGWSVGE